MSFFEDLHASFVIFYSNFTASYGALINWVLILLVCGLVISFIVRAIGLSIKARRVQPQLNMPQLEAQKLDKLCQSLSAAVQIPTVTGDQEGMGALYALLQEQFPQVFATMKVTRLESGSLLLYWRCGRTTERLPVLLCAHMDVVPVEGQNWGREPFDGTIEDGFIHGRGALDCKSTLIGLLSAAESLLEEGFRPNRDIYFAFGSDEETGGAEGATALAKQLRHRGLKFDFIMDEGCNITTQHLGDKDFPAALIGVAEKGSATFRLTAHGRAGHAAMPPAHTAVGLLAEAICRIEAAPMHKKLLPVMRQCITLSAPAMGFLQRMFVANLPATKGLLFRFTKHNLQMAALLHTTFAVTQASGAQAPNVLPETAQATINARLLQGDSGQGVLEYLQALLSDLPVAVEMLGCTEPSAVTSPLGAPYQLIASVVEETFGKLPCIPAILPAGTDTKHYTAFSDSIFRFMPLVTDPQTLSAVHGADERVSCESLGASVVFYENLLKKL